VTETTKTLVSSFLCAVFVLSWLAWSTWNASLAQSSGPVIVVETSKGTVQFEDYPEVAPEDVVHHVGLGERRF